MWILYLVIINALAFLLMLSDKKRAERQLWRIPEKVLFLAAFFGGALGIWFGMFVFRHKTKKRNFMIAIPILLVIQLAAGYCIYTLI